MTVKNLPQYATEFVGRSKETEEIVSLLNQPKCRVLTLFGTGGIGKTRLAITVAETLSSSFADGMYFVPLQPIVDVETILVTIASILHIQFHNTTSPREQFLHFLHDKQILLVIDNFEHLLAGADLLVAIVATAPDIKLLVTSRTVLNLRSEWLYPVVGMDYPLDDNRIENYGAVQLFAERARQVRRSFSLDTERESVAQVCRLIEGMPLAIELAATWLKHLSCADIAREIEQSFDFLTTNLLGMPDRHHSVRAVVAHSWSLLSEGEQAVFMKLSVFRGGFTREATEVVAGASLFILSDLVDKSMLRLHPDGRYDIHELLRQYAVEKLDDLPQVRENVLDKHSHYYAKLIEIRQELLIDATLMFTLKQSSIREIDNLRAAWDRSIENRMVEEIQQLVFGLGLCYLSQNWYQQGKDIVDAAVKVLHSDEPIGQRGIALGFALSLHGTFLHQLNQLEKAKQQINKGVAILRVLDAGYILGFALTELSFIAGSRGNIQESQVILEEVLALAIKLNAKDKEISIKQYLAHNARIAGRYQKARHILEENLIDQKQDKTSFRYIRTLALLAETIQEMGQYQKAHEYLRQILPVSEKVSSLWSHGQHHEWLGHVEHALGNYDAAHEALQTSLHIAYEHGTSRRISFALVALGDLMLSMRNYDQAKKHYQEAVALARQSDQNWQVAWGLKGLGQVACARGDYEQAQEYLQNSLSLSKDVSWSLGTAQVYQALGVVATAQARTNDATFYFHQALATNLVSEAPPVILATLVGLAELLAYQGYLERAIELLGLALIHSATHADTRHLAQNLLDELEAELPEDLFEAAFKQGQNHDLEVVVAILLDELANNIGQVPQRAVQELDEPLTKTEIEVLRLMDSMLSYPEIAARRNVSLNTIKTHRSNVYSKLSVHSRAEAVQKARDFHLI